MANRMNNKPKVQFPDGFGAGCFGIVLAGVILVPLAAFVLLLVA